MQLDDEAVTLRQALEQVAGNPDLVAAKSGAFGEDLKFPLTHHDFGVDAFDIEPRLEADVQVLVDHLAAMGKL